MILTNRRFRLTLVLSVVPALSSILSAVVYAGTPAASGDQPAARRVWVASLPVNFEPNSGQTSAPARFLARTGALEIDLRYGGFDLQFGDKDGRRTRVGASFVDARANAEIAASDRKTSETNYLLGQDPTAWRTHIPNFGRVTYSNLYPGIDAVFYGNGRQLEHDFVVAPGADYHQIRLHWDGASQIVLDAAGNLRLVLEDRELSLHKPVVYQNTSHGKAERQGRFVLRGHDDVEFEIGEYDRTQPLYIDPVLSYSTYLANLSIYVDAMTADASGNAYVTGMDFTGSYPVTTGAFQTSCAACASGTSAVFVTKLNATGSAQVFSTYLGGSYSNQPVGIAVDGLGDTIVVGWTESADFPVKNPISHGYVTANYGPYGFITSLSPDGSSLNYSSILGGGATQGQSSSTYTNGVAIDSSGNAYISGTTDSPVFPVTTGALNSGTPASPNEIVYVSKLAPSGSLVYSGLLGNVSFSSPTGSGPIGVVGIAVDAAGEAYIAGDAGGLWPTTTGAYQTQFSGGSTNKAPFVTKVSADGSSLLYSTFLGVDAAVTGIALDPNGDAFVAGSYAPSNFPTTPNAYKQTLASGTTASIFSELNPSGTQLLYSSFFYGASGSYNLSSAIALDASQNIWLAGFTEDPQFPLVNPIQSVPAQVELGTGTAAGTLSEFDPTGTTLLFSTYFSGPTTEAQIYALALGGGMVYIAGTAGDDLYTTPGAYLNTVSPPPPDYDYTYGFVAAIDPSAAAPAICVAYPANLGVPFGYVRTGTTATQTLTIQNCGTQSLTISGAQASSSAYTIPSATNLCLTAVAPGNSCTLSITFSPTQVQAYPAVVTLTSNASPPETFVPLGGSGAVPVISVTSNTTTFQPTLVGVTAPSIFLAVGNGGFVPLTLNLTQTTISPQFAFSTSSGCNGPIFVGSSSCIFTITFTPQSAGNITGTLTIASNDPATPNYMMNLTGEAYTTYPAPVVTSISPQTVAIGSTSAQLNVYGSNFFPSSVITVNGEALSTTYQDQNFVYATLDPAFLGSMAELAVTVSNPAPGGGTSTPVTLTTYLSIPMELSAMVYEPYSRLLYASIPAGAASNPNSVLPISPVTGAVGTPIAVESNPGPLAVSGDGQYLYVASNGQNAIQRINLTTLTIEKTFPLPVDPTYGNLQVKQLAVVPGSPQTVVAALFLPDVDPDEAGMAAFNDAGLINWIRGVGAYPVSLELDSFAFAGSPPVIYGTPASALYGGFFPIVTLTSSGLQYTQPAFTPTGTGGVTGDLVVSDGSLLYTQTGQIWNPSTQSLVGTYNPAPMYAASVIPDDSLGRTFFLDTLSSCVTAAGGICVYDQTSLNQTGSLAFPAVYQPELEGLVRWGNDGFAMFAANSPSTPSSNQIISFRTSLALPNSGTNPAPTLASLSTPYVAPGGPNFLLGVLGSNFVRGAVIDFNGSPRTTTYQSATQLTAYISQADIAAAGTAQITAVNPAPGGGTSSALTLTITPLTQISINPTSLSFSAQVLGTPSGPQVITLTNAGTSGLLIGNIGLSGDFAQTNNCSGTLNAGAQCTIDVTFTPSATGARSGSLTLTDNVSGNQQTISLAGTGVASLTITAGNANMTYGGTAPAITPSYSGFVNGDTSASLTTPPTCTTTATSSSPVGSYPTTCSGAVDPNYSIAYTSGTVTVGPAPLSITAPSPSMNEGASLPALAATYSGFVNGDTAASLTTPPTCTTTATSSSIGGNYPVTCSGAVDTNYSITYAGGSLKVTGPGVNLSNAALSFAAQTSGTTSATQTVTVTNTGNTNLTFTAIGASAPFAIAASGTTCSTSTPVAASASCTVAVDFAPTAGGPASGSLSMSDNVVGAPQTVALSGTGEDFSLVPPSGTSSTATITPGQPANYTLSVGGEGGLTGTVTFTVSGCPSEATCTVSPNPVTAGSTPTNVTVSVTTTATSGGMPRSRQRPPVPPLSSGMKDWLMLAWALAALAFALWLGPWARIRRTRFGLRRWQSALIPLGAGLLLALALAACGGGGGGGGGSTSNPGTPAGTYTLTVTGTTGAGATALSHSVTLTLNVS